MLGLQQSTELVCRWRGMQPALSYNKPDYRTGPPTNRHGTGYLNTWLRPTLEPVWIRAVHTSNWWILMCHEICLIIWSMKFLLMLYKHQMQIEACDESKTYLQYVCLYLIFDKKLISMIFHTQEIISPDNIICMTWVLSSRKQSQISVSIASCIFHKAHNGRLQRVLG